MVTKPFNESLSDMDIPSYIRMIDMETSVLVTEVKQISEVTI